MRGHAANDLDWSSFMADRRKSLVEPFDGFTFTKFDGSKIVI